MNLLGFLLTTLTQKKLQNEHQSIKLFHRQHPEFDLRGRLITSVFIVISHVCEQHEPTV